jgi:hypothetical protein
VVRDVVSDYLRHRLSAQIIKRPIAATSPITTLRDSARTLTITESAPSLMSAAPAKSMRIVIQIMVMLLFFVMVVFGQKKAPRLDAKGTWKKFLWVL